MKWLERFRLWWHNRKQAPTLKGVEHFTGAYPPRFWKGNKECRKQLEAMDVDALAARHQREHAANLGEAMKKLEDRKKGE